MKSYRFLVVLGFAIACGGAEDNQLLSDAGTPIDQSAPPVDGSQPVDASLDVNPQDAAVQDVVTIVDAAPDVPTVTDTQIQCGNTTCSAQTQLCCYHVGATTGEFTCVAGFSDCQDTNDVPINCSSNDNCASEGEPGYICCATPGGPANPSAGCTNSTSAAQVLCQATCDAPNFIVGCSTQQQNCPSQETCAVSVCSLPGYDICK